jgi:hypothetical protein
VPPRSSLSTFFSHKTTAIIRNTDHVCQPEDTQKQESIYGLIVSKNICELPFKIQVQFLMLLCSVKGSGLDSGRLRVWFELCHLPSLWLWTNDLSFVCFLVTSSPCSQAMVICSRRHYKRILGIFFCLLTLLKPSDSSDFPATNSQRVWDRGICLRKH